MSPEPFDLRQIGVVASTLNDVAAAPKQGAEGAPGAWVVLDGTPVVDLKPVL